LLLMNLRHEVSSADDRDACRVTAMRHCEPAGVDNQLFEQPPVLVNVEGSPRRVGVEIEFMGPTAAAVAEALARGFGASIETEDLHAFQVRNTPLGDLSVELDLRYAHPQRPSNRGLIHLGRSGAAWLGSALQSVVPRELITGPLEIGRLGQVDEAIGILRTAGAKGRGTVLFESLGLHFNIEPPSLDSDILAAYLKAFLLLNDRIREATTEGRRRLMRALPPDYPATYVRKVLSPEYWPDITTFIDDYLIANPTRRRALDLLPCLAHLDEARVRTVLPREKIGKRGVLHYRLPLAHVSEPGWGIASDWNRWVEVERLASDRAKLVTLCREFLATGVLHGSQPPGECAARSDGYVTPARSRSR
jgi:hypothetical protein